MPPTSDRKFRSHHHADGAWRRNGQDRGAGGRRGRLSAQTFNPRELLARIKAVLRRGSSGLDRVDHGESRISFNGWTIDVGKRDLKNPDGVLVALTAGEFDLLVALAERPHRVLSRDQLLDLTRGREAGPFDRSVDVQLSRLRRKVEKDPKDPELIKTVRGGGYMFTGNVETTDK